jgi:protein arginine kinase activator
MDAARVPDPAVRCAVCGLSAKEFALLGRLGCPACYEALAAEVDGVLRATHRGAEHTGSRPRSSVDPALVPAQETGPAAVAEREVLRLELERAVAEEAFERAAEIRDALRRLQ